MARYVRDADRPHAAEAAVSVIDAMQGRGLGGLLLRRLCHRAAQNGIRVFTAELLTSNHSMLQLFEKLGEVQRHRPQRAGDSTSTSSCRWPTRRRSSWRCAARRPATSASRPRHIDSAPMESWVEGADGSGFGLENLPFGAVAPPATAPPRPAVRIGDHALILAAAGRGRPARRPAARHVRRARC